MTNCEQKCKSGTHDYGFFLKRKECQEVLNGERFEWDYKIRKKIEKLEEIRFAKQVEQSDLYDENGNGDYGKYIEIEKVVNKIEEQIKELKIDLEENVRWEIIVLTWSQGKCKL